MKEIRKRGGGFRKRIAAAVLSAALLVTCAPAAPAQWMSVPASAAKIEITAGNFVLEADDTAMTAVIKKYNGTETSLVINNVIYADNGLYYTVNAIGEAAFANNSYIKSVYLPASITSIGASAFSNCTALTDIMIQNSVKTIGAYAFSGCESLSSIYPFTYQFANKYDMTSLDLTAFSNCPKLASLSLPRCVTKIVATDFVGCYSLNTLYIPQETISIDDSPTSQYCKVGTICGYVGTEAWRFAQKFTNIAFKDLNPDPTPTPSAIAAPTITAQFVTGKGVVISWNSIPEADGYYVYRSGNRNPIADTTKTTYTDTNYTRGYTYSYTVASYKGSSVSSDSNQVNVSIPSPSSVDVVKVYGKVSGFGEVYSGEVIYIELVDSDGYTIYTETNDGNYTIYDVPRYEKYTMIVKMPGCPERRYTISTTTADVIQNVTLRRWGDADGDGKITATDATQVLKYDAGMTSKLSNADGYVLKAVSTFGESIPSAKDATQIIRYLSYYNLPSRLDSLVSQYAPQP